MHGDKRTQKRQIIHRHAHKQTETQIHIHKAPDCAPASVHFKRRDCLRATDKLRKKYSFPESLNTRCHHRIDVSCRSSVQIYLLDDGWVQTVL
mmetsp:Transcript_75504/g.164730  ORF Transcript_75504/g.164730 Transcript_75504/m.164730 type:complete len:93 (-) Transcript_75504:2065-2343(-)